MKHKINKFILTSLLVCLLIWCSADVYLRYLEKTFPKEEIEGWFEPITSKYGINIVYEIGDDFFSDLVNPIIPAGPDRSSKVTPIRHRVLATYPDILDTAFKKYPVGVITGQLKSIQFAAEIDHAGFKYGGSYDPFRKIIYLVNHGWIPEDDAQYTIHHELSSLLLKVNTFSVDQWTDHNPETFQYFNYIYESWNAEKEARKKISDNECYEMGMVTDYGLTNLENDFNEYSGMILTYPQKFKQIMNQYPRVRGKFLVWLEFYRKIDPIFTEEYLLGQ